MQPVELISSIMSWLWKLLSRPEIGSVASVVGSLISLRVWFTVRDIRRRVLFRLRAPEVIVRLKNHATLINDLMNDFDASLDSIETEIALASEALKNVREKITGNAKTTVDSAILVIKRFRNTPKQNKRRDSVREIYTQLLISVAAIEHQIADIKQEP